MSEPTEQAFAATFELAVHAENGITAREAAQLVLAAVADECCNVTGAVSSLEPWLTDPTRFSDAFCTGVRALLSAALSECQALLRARRAPAPDAAESTPGQTPEGGSQDHAMRR